MSKCYDIDVRALEAIRARIAGEWDNPALVAFGPLSTDTLADVDAIAKEGICRMIEPEN